MVGLVLWKLARQNLSSENGQIMFMGRVPWVMARKVQEHVFGARRAGIGEIE